MTGRDLTEERSFAPVLTERRLQEMTNAELDELFRACPPGGIPDGKARGTALVFTGSWPCKVISAVVYLLGWQGKVVAAGRGDLKNRLSPLRIQAIRGLIAPGPSWVDGRPCGVIDYSRTSIVAKLVRDEIRLVSPQLYLGVVWLGRRRIAWFALRTARPS